MICSSDKSTDKPIRSDLVARVKRQLLLDTYDEDAKLDAILDRLTADVLASGDQSTDDASADKADAKSRSNSSG